MRQLNAMPLAVSHPVAPVPAAAPAAPRVRVGKVCISVQGATPAELLSHAESAIKESIFIEFRLDLLAKPGTGLAELKAFLGCPREGAALATWRRKPYGGKFTGSLNAALEILQKAAEAGCHMVDLEVESAEQMTRPQLTKFRSALRAAGASLLISSHDLTRTRRAEGLSQVAKK